MPTYEYRCDNDHTFEVTQSMSEDALDECTICGAPARRILFAPAVHFKGSGFYTTDYARKKGNSKSANGSEGKSDSKESTGSDSKSSSDSGSSGDSSSSSSSGSGDKAAAKKD